MLISRDAVCCVLMRFDLSLSVFDPQEQNSPEEEETNLVKTSHDE